LIFDNVINNIMEQFEYSIISPMLAPKSFFLSHQ